MMMPCPEFPMSIDNAAWHPSDEAAGFVIFFILKKEAT
jgi:hypothetical protein